MIPYLLVILYEIIVYYLGKKNYKFLSNKKNQIVMMILPIVLLCMLRSVKLGLNDTEKIYYQYFLDLKSTSLFDFLEVRGYGEFLFFAILKFIILIFNNYRCLLIILAIPYFYAVTKHIYNYSNNYLISIIVFIAMYYLYSFYLLKQCVAMGILVLSYKYICDKKPLKFILLVILAALFHKMSLIFLMAYPICRYKKFNYLNYIVIFLVFLIARLWPGLILYFVNIFDYTHTIINYLNFGIYTSGANVSSVFGFLILLIITLTSHLACRGTDNDRWNIDMNLLTLGCIFFALSPIVIEFYRISIIFTFFSITRLSCFKINFSGSMKMLNKYSNILKLIMIVIFISYFLFVMINNLGANPYIFMWG